MLASTAKHVIGCVFPATRRVLNIPGGFSGRTLTATEVGAPDLSRDRRQGCAHTKAGEEEVDWCCLRCLCAVAPSLYWVTYADWLNCSYSCVVMGEPRVVRNRSAISVAGTGLHVVITQPSAFVRHIQQLYGQYAAAGGCSCVVSLVATPSL